MNNFFIYDNLTGELQLDDPNILLIKEFAALNDAKRNKTKEDPTGVQKSRFFRELKYIYLALNWNSPYRDYEEQDRHAAALEDAEITEEEFNDPVFRAACRKFKELQESNRSIRLLKAAQNTVDKFVDYFNNIDVEERDLQTGKPIWKVETIIKELTSLHKVHEELTTLEIQVKKDISETSKIRGGAQTGFEFQE